MPYIYPAIEEVVAWLGSTAFEVAGVTVSYGTIIEVALVAGSIAYSSAQNAKLRNQLNSLMADRGRDEMGRDPLAFRRMIYGLIPLTGPIVFMATEGTKNENLHIVVVLAGHEVDNIGQITFDNGELVPLDGSGNAMGKYAGFFTCIKFVGTPTQVASSELQTAFPGVWTVNHRLSEIAYIHCKFKYNNDLYPNGLPTVKAYVRGRKIYDPRDITQDPATPSTWKWSCNSALCLADYIHNADWGRAIAWARIKSADLIEAANICEEAIGTASSTTRQGDVVSGNNGIGFTTQLAAQTDGITVGMQVSGAGIPSGSRITYINYYGPAGAYFFNIDKTPTSSHSNTTITFGNFENRYETHGTVTSDQLSDTVIGDLAGAMAGRAVDTGGLWTIRAGAYRTPTVTLTDDDLIGSFSMMPRQSRSDTYNGVKGTYISPINKWVASDFPAVKNDTYMGWDGGVRLWKDIALPFTISPAMAQRLAKIDLERGRQQIVVEGTYKMKAFECMPVDTVKLTRAEVGWINKESEVTNWKFSVVNDPDGRGVSLAIKLSLRETVATVWDWADGSETVVDLASNTNLPNPYNVPTPTGLALTSVGFLQADGTIIPRLQVDWNLPNNQYVEQGGWTLIEFKKSSDSIWIPWDRVRGDITRDFINDVNYGINYDVRITHLNQLGVRSNGDGVSSTVTYNTVTNFPVAGDITAPATPSGLAFVTGTGKAVSLSWNANTEPDFDYYVIERSPDNSTWSTIARVSANRFVDVNVTLSSNYYYRISGVDFSGNQSTASSSVGPATPGVIGTGSIDTTAPGDPSAPTLSSSGSRLSGDGTIVSYMIIGMPALTTLAIGLNLFLRVHGDTEWILYDQKIAGSWTATADGLTPGKSYDIGAQAFSIYGYTSNIVALNSQTAPNTSTGPATPSGGTLLATGVVPKFQPSSSVFFFGTCIGWNPNTEADFDHYEVKATTTDSDGATDYSWTPQDGANFFLTTFVPSAILYNAFLNPGYVRVRAINRTGLQSNWLRIGNANSAASLGAGNSATRDVGISNTTVPSGIWVAADTIVVTLAGGSAEESFNVDITAWHLSAKPSHISLGAQSDNLYHVRYDWDDVGNSSTNAVIKISHFNGTNTTAGALRVGVIPLNQK